MLRAAAVLSTVAVLGGCAKNEPDAGPLTVTRQGVGAITRTTPFARATLEKVFPGHALVEGTVETEGMVVGHELAVKKGDETLLVIRSGDDRARIQSVSVYSPTISGPGGAKVGDTVAALKRQGPLECAPGVEERSGDILCTRPGAPEVIYVASGEWGGPDGELPPPDVGDGFAVESIAWRP